ncbi:MAG: undecaprenyldiphospho-muramoylpentapeptide beta-N-acetylglucosaminyltransferase [Treponema sp.]|nr:undecaprenyldiphospho-muramoylpentapeptide beta-N-acetylglucosaminyltransferase [Treponema sp.]
MPSIAFTGGGTGGHIYPGLAVASRLEETLSCRIFWIGSSVGMDRSIVEDAGLPFFGIPSGKLRRYLSLHNLGDVFKVIMGFFAARRILKREKPALLFSKGGFVSVPPCAAARSLGIPVFTHESDYSPGLATRINSRFAERIFIPYKESARFFGPAGAKVRVSGNPIRKEFSAADPQKGRAFLGLGPEERVLLVLGGSQGSQEINGLVREALGELTRHYTVIHQTGETAGPAREEGSYKSYPYFKEEMAHVIAAAELVLCRSGAGTIWECKSLNKPIVLIPLRGSGTRGDQVENARIFEEAGAAISYTGDSAQDLARIINSLAEDSEKRLKMAEARIVEKAEALGIIIEEILERIGEKSHG